MIPAEQRLKSADLSASKVDDGLVMELKLIGLERLAKVELERSTLLHLCIHLGLEKVVSATPIGFGAVKRHVGVAQELIGFFAVGGRHCDADTGSDDHHLER